MKDRKAWLEERRQFIGSSDAAKVLGQSDWGGPVDVWMDKIQPSHSDDEPTGHAARGRATEDMIAELYELLENRTTMRQPARRMKGMEHIGANIDRLVRAEPERELDVATLEIKSPGYHRLSEIKSSGKLPNDWLLQIQHQLLVTGHPSAVLAVLDWEAWNLLLYTMAPHPDIQAAMIGTYADFWRHVEDRVHPEIDSPALPSEIPYIEHSEYVLCNDPDVMNALDDHLTAKAYEKQAKSVKEKSVGLLKQYMVTRDLRKIEVPGYGKVSWSNPSESTDWKACVEHLAPYCDPTEFRAIIESYTKPKAGAFRTYAEKQKRIVTA
jgi:putative phage-type endonuclease